MEIVVSKPTSQEAIRALQVALSDLPQQEMVGTEHLFANGVYCRKLTMPANCTVVGKEHKGEHFFILLEGEMTVTQQGMEPERIKAPRIYVSQPGAKRALYTHTETTCLGIYRTDLTDVTEIEAELMVLDDTAMFDANNELKVLTWSGQQ
jgi:quercetin dioxygenase-like cupin family protein